MLLLLLDDRLLFFDFFLLFLDVLLLFGEFLLFFVEALLVLFGAFRLDFIQGFLLFLGGFARIGFDLDVFDVGLVGPHDVLAEGDEDFGLAGPVGVGTVDADAAFVETAEDFLGIALPDLPGVLALAGVVIENEAAEDIGVLCAVLEGARQVTGDGALDGIDVAVACVRQDGEHVRTKSGVLGVEDPPHGKGVLRDGVFLQYVLPQSGAQVEVLLPFVGSGAACGAVLKLDGGALNFLLRDLRTGLPQKGADGDEK